VYRSTWSCICGNGVLEIDELSTLNADVRKSPMQRETDVNQAARAVNHVLQLDNSIMCAPLAQLQWQSTRSAYRGMQRGISSLISWQRDGPSLVRRQA